MLSNYFFIKYIAEFLNNELKSFRINEIFSQEKNKLVISLSNIEEKDYYKFLEFSVNKDFPYLILKEDFKKVKKNFAQLFDFLYDMPVESIYQYNDDRIITIRVKDNYTLNFIFLTGKQNFIIEKNSFIIDAFKHSDEIKNTDFSSLLMKKLESKPEEEEIQTVRDYIKSKYFKFGNIYLEEVLFNTALSKSDILTEEKKSIIDNEFEKVYNKIQNPKYILYEVNDKFVPSLIELNHFECNVYTEYENINSMMKDFVKKHYRNKAVKTIKEEKIEELSKQEKLLKSKIKSIEEQLKKNVDYQKFLEFGNVILYNKNSIKKGDKYFIYNNCKITLDEKLSPLENANKYFDKYKKGKNNLEDLKEKLSLTKHKLEEILKLKDKISSIAEYKLIKKMENKVINEKQENPDLKNFRIFKLDENFEIWVGKNSLANDLLTTRYSSQNDLWFHIRDYSGSHTVLKKNKKNLEFPKNYITIAASVAAYYSKAKNAGTVAVSYCERKYVKKRKGLKEGTVIMEREKVIYVKPEIPHNI